MTNAINTIISCAVLISPEEYDQLQAEFETLISLLESDPVANYSVFMEMTPHQKSGQIRQRVVPFTKRVDLTAFISLKDGCFPSELNERQARVLMGLEHPMLNSHGKVDARWALDKISRDLSMGWEQLIKHIENIAKVKKRLNELERKLGDAVIDDATEEVPNDGLGEE